MRRGRWEEKRHWIEKLPFLAIAVFFGWLTRRASLAGNPFIKWIGIILAGLLTLIVGLVAVVAAMGLVKYYTPPSHPVQELKVEGTPEQIARKLQARIREELQLPCSIGIASNKLCAKIAAGLRKPDGLVTVPGVPKFRLTSPAGSILPLALTEARMVPCLAAAVRSAAVPDEFVPGCALQPASTIAPSTRTIMAFVILLRLIMCNLVIDCSS